MVMPTIIHQSKDTTDGYPHELWVRFNSSHETFELQLSMNRQLLAPHYKETYMENNQMVFRKKRKHCYYHGSVVRFPNWSVAMSTCTGLRGTFGDYSDMKDLYHIEPFERISNEIEQTHILYVNYELSIEKRNGTCGYKDSHKYMVEPPPNFITPHNRVRRQSATRIVEWVIVNDRRQFIAQGQNLARTAMRSIDIANTVDLLYSSIGVRVSLIGVLTWSSQDLIAIVSNPDMLLNNFQSYRTALASQYPSYDSSMLVTGIDLDGQAVGIAPVGTMCTSFSNGVTQDTGSSVASVGAVAAHEMGHIFDMSHDDGRGCTCAGLNNMCIMSSSILNPPPVEWSSCSVSEMNAYLNQGFESCLLNEPSMIFGDPACGNGIREGEEVCDCGTPQMCDDPCCDATTCQLVAGAMCSNREVCCSNCQFIIQGSVCRAADDECDIAETCTGLSGECPADRSLQNGADCDNEQAHCFDGRCQNLDNICRAFFGPSGTTSPSAGPQLCFNLNTRGDVFGNCGHNSTDYIGCASTDVNCGQLHCLNTGDFIGSVGASLQLPSFTTQEVTCRSFTTQPGSDIMPGLVPNGAKCGENRVCINHQCVVLQITPCPSANSLPCSGNGQCNDLDQCTCNEGFMGSNCNTRTVTTNVNGGWTQWTSWSGCTITCGRGSRTQTRTCTNLTPQGSGADCVGSPSSTESCNLVACPAIANESSGSGTTVAVVGGTAGGVVVITLIIVLCVVVVMFVRRSHKKSSDAIDNDKVYDEPSANTVVFISPNPAYKTMKSDNKDRKDYDYIKDDYLCIYPHQDTIKMESNPSYGLLKGTNSADNDTTNSNVTIQPNPSYDVEKHHRKTSEDQYGYVEPNEFVPNAPTNDEKIKMEDNPSHGLATGSRGRNTESQRLGSDVIMTSNPSYNTVTQSAPNKKGSDYDYV